MLNTLRRWFQAPRFPDDSDKTRNALLLNVILNTFIITMPVLIFGSVVGGPFPRREIVQIIIGITWVTLLWLRYIMFIGRVATAGTALVSIVYVATTLSIYNLGTIRAPATSFYILIIVTAGLTIHRRAIVWTAGISTITIIGLLISEINGWLPSPNLDVTATQGVTFMVIFGVISVLLFLAVKSIDEALAHARQELEERQRTEEILRTSEERFRAMIENISDAIALVDAQGKVFYLSPAAERILGFPVNERIGYSAFDNILESEEASKLQDIFRELVVEPRATRSFTLRAQHKDGSVRRLEASAKNLLDLTSVKAIVINYRDITERINAEREREKYIEELGKQNAELERFTYTVSHDLRSPLVTIKGFIGMLNQDLKDSRPDKIQDDLERISGATEKMDALLSELLELSRIGRIVNPPEKVNLARVVQDALDTDEERIRSNEVTVKYPADLPSVYGDRIRLREVFENLIDNAAKYMGEQIKPTIEIGIRNQAGEQIIFVKDNGLGIESEYQEKIFGLFEKLDPRSEGTGIGLALVKRIIETHGGRIWVESEGLGKGSAFCFTLPGNKE